ncbi:iq-domain [Sarracenia purpurea var. burkii]
MNPQITFGCKGSAELDSFRVELRLASLTRFPLLATALVVSNKSGSAASLDALCCSLVWQYQWGSICLSSKECLIMVFQSCGDVSLVKAPVTCRAIRALKGIIRLQALIRGHLVRRQAVASLRCMQAIVKFQALVRGQQVRLSGVGCDELKKCKRGKATGCKQSDFHAVNTVLRLEKLSRNAFVTKKQGYEQGYVKQGYETKWYQQGIEK